MSSLNTMFDVATTREAALLMHPPGVVFALLALLPRSVRCWLDMTPVGRGHLAAGANTWPAVNLEADAYLNPLATIQSAAGLLAEEDTSAEVRQELLGIVSKECARLSASIVGLLYRAPALAPPQVREGDITAIIQGAAKEAEFALCGRNIRVLQGNLDQIQPLITFLALSAVHPAPAGDEPVLSAHLAREGIFLAVTHRGRGSFINSVAMRLFGSGREIADSGSAIAREVVRQHGGTMTRSFNARKEQEFSLWLPCGGTRERGGVDGMADHTGGNEILGTPACTNVYVRNGPKSSVVK